VGAGAPAVVLREKDLPPPERLAIARRLRTITASAGAALVVASDVALAREVGADGVHLAARDPWPEPAGSGRPLRVGRSCHSVGDLLAVAAGGGDYATFSPVFATASKPGYGPALGLDGLRAGCRAVARTGAELAVYALGGVGPGRAADCLAAGAAGVAVLGAVMRAPDPAAAVRALLAELNTQTGRSTTAYDRTATTRTVLG
jgi:thiamine-phosphate pyrophosphorylase